MDLKNYYLIIIYNNNINNNDRERSEAETETYIEAGEFVEGDISEE